MRLKVFHGSEDHRTKADIAYFSSDKDFSKSYGKVKKYMINLNNPFDTSNEKHINLLLNRIGDLEDPYDHSVYESYEALNESGLLGSDTWEIFEQHIDIIERMGFDSMIVFEGGIQNYVTFNNNQVTVCD